MSKPVEELCEIYISDIITKHEMFKQNELTNILKKYNYEFSINCLNDLSNYYDSLELHYNDEEWLKEMEGKYGKNMADWSELVRSE